MLPVKHTVIYTFFAITSVQNTCFCSVFNALASKNPAKSCYVQCFFHFWSFFHCRKATKMTQNSISIPSCAQTPKNPRKMSKTPPYSGLGAKPFLAPPPAKADIATAILTNVIEHLVLLFCPPISTPSLPKRCGRISRAWSEKFLDNLNNGYFGLTSLTVHCNLLVAQRAESRCLAATLRLRLLPWVPWLFHLCHSQPRSRGLQLLFRN